MSFEKNLDKYAKLAIGSWRKYTRRPNFTC